MDNRTLFEKTTISRLFIIVTIPGIISMLVSSLYSIIDGVFIGQLLGADAFAALQLAIPFVIINFALADLIGVGSSVPIAIKLGEGDEKTASNIFSSALLLIFLTGIGMGAILFIFGGSFVRLMGADEHLVDMAAQYLRVYAGFAPLTTIIFAADNYLRICGKVKYSMFVNILMSVIAIILEFLFLVVFRFDIWSAALATCLSMFICAMLALMPFLRGQLQLRFVKPRIDRKVLSSILTNGTPTFLNNIAGRVASIFFNIFLLRLGGSIAVSAYGVLMYVDSITQPVLYGFCDSLQPAIGYNYGAKNHSRIAAIRRLCFLICGMMSLLMAGVMFLAKAPLIGIFVKAEDTGLMDLSIQALSLFVLSYLTRWISIVSQSYFSAIGKAKYATVISLSIAFVFPMIMLFSLESLGLDGLWLNLPFASLLTAILSFILMAVHLRKNKV
ncbi:MAG TPA: MATE family efflux transporter [Porphyromonadaceae bacterium]|jgi:putative MATE family efflux protein|nr:MATE family efflux transporter [Porphyromonadaceae bacterium]HBL33777.1 MATE family efflux transporter [Porphyromonadaceae bacterium]HBX19995.1 MATE family efflux transporter [Porphyromonadaceae bacterium]HCM22259.1 MATE family efflux transporter [Porphyromonadaceae bacterium]